MIESSYSRKLRQNEIPTDQDWEAHLIEAHTREARITPRVFGLYTNSAGLNSYQVLAQSLETRPSPSGAVLDLGCGDGFLSRFILPHLDTEGRVLGVDMAAAEIALASKSVNDRRVSFVAARAQSLPVPDSSIDHVLCHLALMLMSPLEPVLAEVGRVLKPRGWFSAVIGGLPSRRCDFLHEIQKIVSETVAHCFPSLAKARTGDPRVRSSEGLSGLFRNHPAFARQPEVLEFDVQVRADPEGVWDFFKDMYLVDALPDPIRDRLRNEIVACASSQASSGGGVSFPYPMRRITVSRA